MSQSSDTGFSNFELKRMQQWTQADVLEWIQKDLEYSEKETEKLINLITEYGIDGTELLGLGKSDFEDSGINNFVSMNLEHRIAIAKKQYRTMNIQNLLIKDKITNESKYPDCISLADSGPPRCVMSCGCAITASSMRGWVEDTLEKCLEATDVYCPEHKKHMWEWGICVTVADLDDEELQRYTILRAKRESEKSTVAFKNCPHCSAFLEKPNDLNQLCVRCVSPNCKGGDFCWVCLRPWKSGSGSYRICGYDDCSFQKYINQILRECEENEDPYLKIMTPAIRACPNCMTLILREAGCKHMACKGCAKSFCFICLGVRNDQGKYPCGDDACDHRYKCTLAPRQQF